MILFLFLAGSTITWCLFVKFILHKTVTWTEFGISIAVGLLTSAVCIFLTLPFPVMDIEVLNGEVTGKYSKQVSCSHSYPCNPRTVCSRTGKTTSCRTVWSTCYEHSYDMSWRIKSTVGEITIHKEDRRGLTQPARWTKVVVGEPASVTNSYRSYVREAPEHFMSHVTGQAAIKDYEGKIPKYPDDIYDYYRINRVVEAGIKVPDKDQWNQRTSEFLKKRGADKKVNLVTVFTNEKSYRFSEAINASWFGGKKNDVVVIISTETWPKISWVRVLSWTDAEIFKISTRNELIEMSEVNIDKYFDILGRNIDELFVYRSMRDFEHLSENQPPPLWAIIVSILVVISINIGTTIFMHRNEV